MGDVKKGHAGQYSYAKSIRVREEKQQPSRLNAMRRKAKPKSSIVQHSRLMVWPAKHSSTASVKPVASVAVAAFPSPSAL